MNPVSSKETTNNAQLCRLLGDVGTKVLRQIFDGIHPPSSLYDTLNSTGVKSLLRWKKLIRTVSTNQWKVLYPVTGLPVSSTSFDIPLLMVLFKEICPTLKAPPSGWNKLPPSADTSQEADIVRIKFYHNQVSADVSQAAVSDADFIKYWTEIRISLIRLGGSAADIDALQSLYKYPDTER